jgi:ABC-type Fe3+ transport system substrate-binding protein
MASINWTYIEESKNPTVIAYRASGEYAALKWLKAYGENRAAAEPEMLVEAVLRSIASGSPNAKNGAEYALTLMRHL